MSDKRTRPNIKLTRIPTPDDFCRVDDESKKQCVCSDALIQGLEHGDETICKPCAARQVLNGVASLAAQIQ